ncbi:MAG: Calx-beta domain-containing protein [Bacteroidota bacterium]|nr:Calx-beta domain-containing protein [Bacteroidota bacterium]
MKKILVCVWVAFIYSAALLAQKPEFNSIITEKMPLYCGSTGSGSSDSSRLPILFNISIAGLDQGISYKYYVRMIKISDTSDNNATGAGTCLFLKSNGKWTSTNSPDLSTVGGHDTITLNGSPIFQGWFGVIYNNDSRFTPGSYVYPMIVLQEIGGTSVMKKCGFDSIKVLNFSSSSGNNNGTAIYGTSFANSKNFVLLYDNTNGTNSRPITIAYAENDNINVSNVNTWYTNNVNGKNGAWGSIIPNSLTTGIQRIEQRTLSNNNTLYANIESDGIWGNDSTMNRRGGNIKPVFIKSDFAPLQNPVFEFITPASNITESNSTANILVRRLYGNADSSKVDIQVLTGSATLNTDFKLLNNKIVFKPYGSIIDTLRVRIIDDSLTEGNENTNFRLQNPFNGIVNNSFNSHQLNIIENDIPKIRFDKKGISVNEDQGSIKVKIKFDFGTLNSSTFRVVVKYKADSTFIPQEFKIGNSNRDTSMQFLGGKAFDSLEFNIPIINDNMVEKFNDTIILAIRNPSSPATVGSDSLFTLVIIDDDTPPSFSFSQSSLTVNENVGSINVKINKIGYNKNPSDIIMSLHSLTSTAVEGSDFIFSTKILTFEKNRTDTTVNIQIIDDNINENTEKAFFVIRTSFNSRIAKPDTFQLTIIDNDLPTYNISRVTSFKAPNNIVDSINTRCILRGVVYSPNFSTTGLEFTLTDPTGGIQVFNNTTKGYNVTLGDSILVYGRIAQFNGLARITQLDTIIKLASNRTLRTPTQFFTLNENSESKLIKFNAVRLSRSAQWPTSPLAANSTRIVKFLTQTDSFDMLIDSETNIDGQNAPSGFFNITGIGEQNDNSSPFNSGYYIKPRFINDIENTTVPTFRFTTATSLGYENRDSSEGFILEALNLNSNQQISIVIKGGNATRNVDYQSNVSRLFILTPSNPRVNIKIKMIDDAIVDPNENVIFVIRGNQWGTLIGADSIHIMTIIDDESTNIKLKNFSSNTNIYPNPAKNQFKVSSSEIIQSIEVLDITGKIISVIENIMSNEFDYNSSDLLSGKYLIKINSNIGTIYKNLVILE